MAVLVVQNGLAENPGYPRSEQRVRNAGWDLTWEVWEKKKKSLYEKFQMQLTRRII